MAKLRYQLAGAALVALACGCGKKTPAEDSGGPAVAPAAIEQAELPTASHLGFATRVPKDADVFMAGFHAGEMLESLLGQFSRNGIGAPQDPDSESPLDELSAYVGDESFVFVGAGAGSQFEGLSRGYREMSAAWAGFAIGKILDSMNSDEADADFSELERGLTDGLLENWLDAIEKDSRLRVPSVVIGWRPYPEKEAESAAALAEALDAWLKEEEGMQPITFTHAGVSLSGYEMSGKNAFGDFVAEGRTKLAERVGNEEWLEQISPDRIERLLTALENLRFTLATGVVDGRVLLYVGDGASGFRLAATPAESLAATADLKWTHQFAQEHLLGVAFLSQAMVQAALPWLDSSPHWEAASRAVRPPIQDERSFQSLLTKMAWTESELAARDASPWSAILFKDEGWRLESRGGWPDPGIDYQAPLQMIEAAVTQSPAIRAHWVQSRSRNELEWKQVEILGALGDAILNELKSAQNPLMTMIPEGTLPRLTADIQAINEAYRGSFRKGIGDEIAVVADLLGEVPPVPGISQDAVDHSRMPRFIVARPVKDRAAIDAAGASLAASWKDLTAIASEASGMDLPLVLPQSVEGGGLTTWFPPVPFIGGDFLPGVSLNDQVWIMGTSRSLAGDFAAALNSPSSGSETGVIIEIDFTAISEWFGELYQRNQTDIEALTEEAPDEVGGLATPENLSQAGSGLRRLKHLSYRHWLEDATPRTSVHLQIAAE